MVFNKSLSEQNPSLLVDLLGEQYPIVLGRGSSTWAKNMSILYYSCILPLSNGMDIFEFVFFFMDVSLKFVNDLLALKQHKQNLI
jgi:hypothetical protein